MPRPCPVACLECLTAQKGPHRSFVSGSCGLLRTHVHALTNTSVIDLPFVGNFLYPSDLHLAELAFEHLQTPGIGSPLSPSWSAILGLCLPVQSDLTPSGVGYSLLPIKGPGRKW